MAERGACRSVVKRTRLAADPILPPRQEKHLPDALNEQDAQKLVESVNGTSTEARPSTRPKGPFAALPDQA